MVTTNNRKRKKIKIPFMDSESRIPFVEFFVNGIGYIGLLDTGSESTLFDKSLKGRDGMSCDGTDYNMSLVGLGGETENRRVYNMDTNVSVIDTGKSVHNGIHVTGIVSDLSILSSTLKERYGKDFPVSVVFGGDFLKAYHARIDYRKKILRLTYDISCK